MGFQGLSSYWGTGKRVKIRLWFLFIFPICFAHLGHLLYHLQGQPHHAHHESNGSPLFQSCDLCEVLTGSSHLILATAPAVSQEREFFLFKAYEPRVAPPPSLFSLRHVGPRAPPKVYVSI